MTAQTILPANSVTGAYEVDGSVLFVPAQSTKLTFTQGTPTNTKKMTIAFWVKFCNTINSDAQEIFTGGADGSNESFIRLNGNQQFQVRHDHASDTSWQVIPHRTFQDESGWVHFVVAIDTTQGTASNRVKIYVNGVQETHLLAANYPAEDETNFWNTDGDGVTIGNRNYSGDGYGDYYMSEFCFIDGSAEAPTKFGEFDPDTPTVWRPINPLVNTFGTNGVYLKLSLAGQSTNAAGIGADSSGNGNHYAQSNIAAIYAARQDTPSNNFCTMIKHHASSSPWALSNGNLTCIQTAGATNGLYAGSMMVTKGKWYWEGNIAEAGSGDRSRFGMVNYDSVTSNAFSTCQGSFSGVESSCKSAKHFDTVSGSTTEHTNSGDFADDDIMQWAIDLDNNAIYIGRNGTYLTQSGNSGGDPTSGASKTGAISTSTTIMNGGPMTPYAGHSAGTSDRTFVTFNFGNPPYAPSSGNADANGYGNFEYAPPSGYFAICSKNLAEYG